MIDAETGKPASGVLYGISTVSPDGRQITGQGWGNSKTDDLGEFRLRNLLPGRYAVTARAEREDAANYYSAPVPFEITEGNVEGLVVKVQRGGILSGVAVLENTRDRAALAKLSQLMLHIDVRPAESDSAELHARNSWRTRFQPDGSFRVVGLPPGRAQLVLETYFSAGFTLLRIEHGGVEQSDGIKVGVGEHLSGVRVVMAYGTSTMRGQVDMRRDGAPAQIPDGGQLRVSVRRRGAGRSRWGDYGAEVDARGRFMLEGLAAGEYELTTQGWIRPTPAAPQGMPLPAVKQIVNVPEKGETSVTVVYDLNAKPEGTTP
jgi:hypothetical protein